MNINNYGILKDTKIYDNTIITRPCIFLVRDIHREHLYLDYSLYNINHVLPKYQILDREIHILKTLSGNEIYQLADYMYYYNEMYKDNKYKKSNFTNYNFLFKLIENTQDAFNQYLADETKSWDSYKYRGGKFKSSILPYLREDRKNEFINIIEYYDNLPKINNKEEYDNLNPKLDYFTACFYSSFIAKDNKLPYYLYSDTFLRNCIDNELPDLCDDYIYEQSKRIK